MRSIKSALYACVVFIAAPVIGGEKVAHEFSMSWSAGDVRRVEIDLPPSALRVETADVDTIRVDGRVRIERGGSAVWFAEVLDGISVKAIREGKRLVLTESREGAARSFRARRLDTEWEFRITLPEWTSVETDMTAGEVHMSGNLGNVRVHMRAGEVRVEVPREVVRKLTARTRIGEVHTDTGTRREHREGLFAGTSSWENEEGRTEIEVKLTVGEIHVKLT